MGRHHRSQATPEQLARVYLVARSLTCEQFEHLQYVLRAALQQIDRSRFSDDADEAFWVALREALTGAGATEREIDLVAASITRSVVCNTADADRRDEVLELIAQHLVRTDMTIQIGPRVCDTNVEFPERPRIQ
jgi:hypothetical protein